MCMHHSSAACAVASRPTTFRIAEYVQKVSARLGPLGDAAGVQPTRPLRHRRPQLGAIGLALLPHLHEAKHMVCISDMQWTHLSDSVKKATQRVLLYTSVRYILT